VTSGVTAFIEYSLNGASWFVSEGFSDKEERPAIYAHFKLGNCCMVSLNDFDVSSLLGLAIRILMSNISLNMYIYLGVPRKSWGGGLNNNWRPTPRPAVLAQVAHGATMEAWTWVVRFMKQSACMMEWLHESKWAM